MSQNTIGYSTDSNSGIVDWNYINRASRKTKRRVFPGVAAYKSSLRLFDGSGNYNKVTWN